MKATTHAARPMQLNSNEIMEISKPTLPPASLTSSLKTERRIIVIGATCRKGKVKAQTGSCLKLMTEIATAEAIKTSIL